MDWLHFIGAQYYSEHRFKAEAEKYDVSRRVALNVLKKMDWNDRVYCAIFRDKQKSPVIFGYFTIDKISGLSGLVSYHLFHKYRDSITVSDGGEIIQRGCGEYHTGSSLHIKGAPICEIAEYLEDYKSDITTIGLPMVAGKFYAFDKEHIVRLRRVKFRQGFRLFDWTKCLNDAIQHNMVVSSHYYVNDPVHRRIRLDVPITGELQVVHNYQRKIRGRL